MNRADLYAVWWRQSPDSILSVSYFDVYDDALDFLSHLRDVDHPYYINFEVL